jgi:hypothetical protein
VDETSDQWDEEFNKTPGRAARKLAAQVCMHREPGKMRRRAQCKDSTQWYIKQLENSSMKAIVRRPGFSLWF